jgi:hypothetical protein
LLCMETLSLMCGHYEAGPLTTDRPLLLVTT